MKLRGRFMNNVFGLLGEKLGHSLSPIIHSIALEKNTISGSYNLFEVNKDDLMNVISSLKTLNIKGVNVTIPYKIDIIKYLDNISNEARDIGAVNTILINNKKSIGYNTDYFGFGMLLNKFNIKVKGKIITVLGTGGASKAIAQYVLDKGCKQVIFVTRNIKNANNSISNKVKYIEYKNIKFINDKSIIINCTPVGMYPHIKDSPVNKEDLMGFRVAIDLIYNPLETVFLKYAKENGIKGINGLYMLVGQAIKSQELWNNIKVSNEVVDNIYKMLINKGGI